MGMGKASGLPARLAVLSFGTTEIATWKLILNSNRFAGM